VRSNDARGPSSIMSFKASSDGDCSSYDSAQIKGAVKCHRAESAGEIECSSRVRLRGRARGS
jgi:hypothetical protein